MMKRIRKLLVFLLCAVLCIELLAPTGQVFADDTQGEDPFFASGVWTEERPESDGFYGNSSGFTSTKPTISDGVLKFDKGDAVQMHWKQLEGFTFDKTKTYTIKLDVTVTDFGDDINITTGRRELYLAAGGTYFLVEFNNRNSTQPIRTNTTVATNSTNYNKNVTYTIESVWTPASQTFNTTIKIGEETISTGSRIGTQYKDASTYCSNWVIRCEDGSIEVDNFSFTDGKNTYTEDFERVVVENPVKTETIELLENHSTTYECNINHVADDDSRILFNGKEVFSLSDGKMRILGARVTGEYGAGDYLVQADINPWQRMVTLEVILPSGRAIRRASFEGIEENATSCAVEIYAHEEGSVSPTSVSYNEITMDEYTLTTTEPVYEGFEANVYNLITSFSDAATTRAFAWTALASFIGDSDMAVKYRVKGTDTWQTADAIKEVEATETEDEEYFKADIKDLTPNTEYEYKIGVKGSADEENDWGKSYYFKTASGNENEFSFIAIGDTQGVSWNGNTPSNTGFMYAKAAYEQALKDVPNPAFIFHAGDVVQDGDNKEQWNYYFKSVKDIVETYPQFTAIGNHDVRNLSGDPDNNVEFYFDLHFNHPDNGGMNALDSEITSGITNANVKAISKDADETIYSYNYGDVHFVVLNTGALSGYYDKMLLNAQKEWLEKDLQANACAKWTIVMVHEPDYDFKEASESRSALREVIQNNGVDLVIAGHSHVVSRIYPMKNGEIASDNFDEINQGTGTVYITTGATSNNHQKLVGSTYDYNEAYCAYIASPAYEQAAYTTVDISEDALTLTTKQLNGLVLDTFTIVADSEEDHTYDEGVVKAEADCVNRGIRELTCEVCHETCETYIMPTGHTYSQEAVMGDGGYIRTCACGSTDVTVYTKDGLDEIRQALFDDDSSVNINNLIKGLWGIETAKNYGTVSAYQDTTIVSNRTATVEAIVTEAEIQYGMNGNGVEGFWVGIQVEAPQNVVSGATYMMKSSQMDDWSEPIAYSEGKCWIDVESQKQLEQYKDECKYMTMIYTFDWDGDGEYDQTVTFSLVPTDKIRLVY